MDSVQSLTPQCSVACLGASSQNSFHQTCTSYTCFFDISCFEQKFDSNSLFPKIAKMYITSSLSSVFSLHMNLSSYWSLDVSHSFSIYTCIFPTSLISHSLILIPLHYSISHGYIIVTLCWAMVSLRLTQ